MHDVRILLLRYIDICSQHDVNRWSTRTGSRLSPMIHRARRPNLFDAVGSPGLDPLQESNTDRVDELGVCR